VPLDGADLVQQDAAADNAVPCQLDGELRRACLGDGTRGHRVVELTVVNHMAQRIDVGIGVAVHVQWRSGPWRRTGPARRRWFLPGYSLTTPAAHQPLLSSHASDTNNW
jgi:hypothetical protein